MPNYNPKNERIKTGLFPISEGGGSKGRQHHRRHPEGNRPLRGLHWLEGFRDVQQGAGDRLQEASGRGHSIRTGQAMAKSTLVATVGALRISSAG